MGAAVRSENFYGGVEGDTSLDDFVNLISRPDNQDKAYELINGCIIMITGNASGNHHRINGYIFRKIGNYLDGKKCEVFQDINTYLFSDDIGNCKNVFQPDILVGCDRESVTDRGYEGVPVFIAEVTSKTTAKYDYFVKSARYMQFGVKEYWIIDLHKNQILVFLNGNEDPPTVRAYTFENAINLSVFDDLSIDFSEILKIVEL